MQGAWWDKKPAQRKSIMFYLQLIKVELVTRLEKMWYVFNPSFLKQRRAIQQQCVGYIMVLSCAFICVKAAIELWGNRPTVNEPPEKIVSMKMCDSQRVSATILSDLLNLSLKQIQCKKIQKKTHLCSMYMPGSKTYVPCNVGGRNKWFSALPVKFQFFTVTSFTRRPVRG